MSLNSSFIYGLLEGLLSRAETKLNIIQVGANDGVTNDPLNQWVNNNLGLNNIMLIEPQVDVFESLKLNYAKHPSASFFNCAVGPTGHLKLYRIAKQFNQLYRGITASGITSFNRDYVLSKIKKNLDISDDANSEDFLEELNVEMLPLIKLIENQPNFSQGVDFLQIDTEGFDDVVIYNSNIDTLKPSAINFEFIHLDETKVKKLYQYLVRRKYKLIQWSSEDCCAVRLPN